MGARALKLEVSRAKGRAPDWIWEASWVASSLVKSPVMVHSPPVMASLTVGAESITSSIQMEMVRPTMALGGLGELLGLPSSVRVRATTY